VSHISLLASEINMISTSCSKTIKGY